MQRDARAVVSTSGRQWLRILQLLIDHGELTGGELLRRDQTLPRGTLYTTLKRLEAAQLVTSRQGAVRVEPGPRRRLYKITVRGARCCVLGHALAKALAATE